MPDASLNTMTRIRTTLYNQQIRAANYRASTQVPRGLSLATLGANDLRNPKILEQNSYIIPDSPLRQAPKLAIGGETVYRIGDQVTIYINNLGGPVKLWESTPLPTGLTINSTTGTISGLATVRQLATQYRVTATNDFGQDTIYFSIQILNSPPQISYAGSPFTFTKTVYVAPQEITSIGYPFDTITGILPPGLELNSTTGYFFGTPTVSNMSSQTYYLTATNEGGSTTTEIQITVNPEPPNFSYPPGPYLLTKDTEISSIIPFDVVGEPLFLTPFGSPLPSGLILNNSTGTITGTPDTITPLTIFTVGAVNVTGFHLEYINIQIQDAPPNISYSPSTVSFTQNSLITNMVPVNTGGEATGFSITPALPTGLIFDTSTGTISGTPSNISASQSYVVTATGTSTNSTTINITINPPAPVISYSSPQTYTVGLAITPLVPTSSGGPVSSYSVVGPSLPAGLSLNGSTGVISGTPSAITGLNTYIIQAQNITGTSTDYIDITVV